MKSGVKGRETDGTKALLMTFKCILLIFVASTDGYTLIIISNLVHEETSSLS